MAKTAISVTLDADNLVWLKARAGAIGHRSVSELLDRIVTDARAHGSAGPIRSVVGTIDIDPDDPFLDRTDEIVRELFEGSLKRPMVLKEASPPYGTTRKRKKRRG